MAPWERWTVLLFGNGTDLAWWQYGTRTVVVFVCLWALLRVAGRRNFAQHTSFDLCVTLLLGAILSRAVVGASSLAGTLASSLILVLLRRAAGLLVLRSARFDAWFSGQAIELEAAHRLIGRGCRRGMVSEQDILAGLRHALHTEDLDGISRVVLERDGRISFVRGRDAPGHGAPAGASPPHETRAPGPASGMDLARMGVGCAGPADPACRHDSKQENAMQQAQQSPQPARGTRPCVADAMTRDPACLSVEDTVRKAAMMMADMRVGAIPVCDGSKLVGMLTDRDIIVRCVAGGKPADTLIVRDAMSANPHCCRESDPVESARQTMEKAQVRRLPVVDADHRLVGIVSLGDLATRVGDGTDCGHTLACISAPPAQAG